MRNNFLKLFAAAGGFSPFHLLNSKKVLILTYHRFEETPGSFSVSRAEFSEHLSYLSKYRRVLPLSEISQRLKDGKSLPANTAAITIDDGFRDAYKIAFPLLKENGMPATLFAVTNFLDGKTWLWTDKMSYVVSKLKSKRAVVQIGEKTIELEKGDARKNYLSAARVNRILKLMPDEEKELALEQAIKQLGVEIPTLPPDNYAPVSWEQALEMDKNNLHIGSHTVTHPILTNIPETQLNFELQNSKKRLEEMLERRVEMFCYPNGAVNENVRQSVEKNGYSGAVTTCQGFNSDDVDPLLLKRIDAQKEMLHFAQSVSGFEIFKHKMRAKLSMTG